MKIAVVGCGALGSFYGAKLARSGEEVWFLLRSDFTTVRERGVHVLSPEGEFTVHPGCAREPQEIGACDLVIVALKTTANDQFSALIPPLLGPGTAILTLQNGLGNEEQLAELFGTNRILGGLCFVCLNRVAPGVVQHMAHGRIEMGEFGRLASERTRLVAEALRKAGIDCAVTDRLEEAHWAKLVWNIPFNGLGVASAAGFEVVESGDLPGETRHALGPCLTTDRLLADPRWRRLVWELMLEVVTIGRAKGLNLSVATAERHMENTRIMGAYKASTVLDFELGRPLELESLFLEPLRIARVVGVSAPRLEALCRILEALDSR